MKSEVTAFQLGPDFIIVQFKGMVKHKYTEDSAGDTHVDNMKLLAVHQKGLGTYINLHHPIFECKA